MVEKGITGDVFPAIYQYVKGSSKYLKNYDKNKESSYLKYWGVNNLYRWAMSQRLPVDGFNWVEGTFQFNEDLMKSYNEDSDIVYLIEVDVQYPEKFYELHNDLIFLQKRIKIENLEKLAANLHNDKE